MEKQSNDQILKEMDELIDLIQDREDYKRYKYLSQEMKKNNQLMKIIKDIKSLEKKRVVLDYNKEDVSSIDKEIDSLKKDLMNYPSYEEYVYLQEDLNNIFQSIRSILEQNIN